MKEEETRPLICPFCGAPQISIIQPGTVQLKCKYCGRIILIPPWMGGEIHRCYNHPERLADGKCNDCGGSFWDDCLQSYNLNTREDRAVLYLCPACLRKRFVRKADGNIYAGIAGLLIGMFFIFVASPFGALAVVFGVGLIGYGAWLRGKAPEEPLVDDSQAAEEEKNT